MQILKNGRNGHFLAISVCEGRISLIFVYLNPPPPPLPLSSSGFLRSYFFFVAYCTTPCCYNLHLPQCVFRCLGFVNNCCIFLIVSALCTSMVNHFCESCNTYARYPFYIFIHSRRSRTRSKLFETIPSEGCVSCLVLGRRIFIATSVSPSKASFGQATFRIVETDDTHTKNKAFITFISTLRS